MTRTWPRVEIELRAGRIEDAGGFREARDPAAFELEGPDQPAREGRDERLVEIAVAPDVQRPAAIVEIEAFETQALRLQGLADFLDLLLERFQRVGVAILHGRGRSAERLAARVVPIRFERAVFGDDELDVRGADCDIESAIRSEAVGRHPDLFELARRHAARGCERGQRLVDGLDLARPFQMAAQPREAADARGSRHQTERVDRRVAEHEREIGEMLRREGQALLRVGFEPAAGDVGRCERRKPDQRAQRVLVLQRKRETGLIALDDVEELFAHTIALARAERLLRALEPALGGLCVVAAFGGQLEQPAHRTADVGRKRREPGGCRFAPRVGLGLELRLAPLRTAAIREHRIDDGEQLAAFGAAVGGRMHHTIAQTRQHVAQRGTRALGFDVALQDIRDRLVGRVARIGEAFVDRRLDQHDRLIVVDVHLGSQKIGHDPAQRGAVATAIFLARPGDVSLHREVRFVRHVEIEQPFAGIGLGQRGRLREHVDGVCARRADVLAYGLLKVWRQSGKETR